MMEPQNSYVGGGSGQCPSPKPEAPRPRLQVGGRGQVWLLPGGQGGGVYGFSSLRRWQGEGVVGKEGQLLFNLERPYQASARGGCPPWLAGPCGPSPHSGGVLVCSGRPNTTIGWVAQTADIHLTLLEAGTCKMEVWAGLFLAMASASTWLPSSCVLTW